VILDLAVSPVDPDNALVATADGVHTTAQARIYCCADSDATRQLVHQGHWPGGGATKVYPDPFLP
jgi:hypothetical protein